MGAVETELLKLNEQLLQAIDGGLWDAYAKLCDPTISCFEPEACGQVVTGLPFHKFYFDLPRSNSPKKSTMANPHVRMMGDSAVLSYVRVVQKLDATGAPISVAAMETRVWQKIDSTWKHVHFHRSPM
jgi:ketosteroid isomerase-like protein